MTPARDVVACFQSAETTRSQKYLIRLMKLVDEGHESEIVFTIQRADCKTFSAAADVDPKYAKLLIQANEKSVIIRPLIVEVNPHEIFLHPTSLEFKILV